MFVKKEILAVLALVLVLAGCSDTGSKDVYNGGASGEARSGDASSGGGSRDDGVSNGEDDANGGTQGPGKNAVVEVKPSNWYIRLVAEDPARGMKTASTQLGELEERKTVEKHTLKAMTPFGRTFLDVIFRDPAGVEEGDYKVNFHQYQEGSEDSWSFTVRTDSDNTHADILLTWRGLYVLTPYIDEQNRQRYREYRSTSNPLIKNMKLVDTGTGQEIAAAVDGKVQTYAFNMNGQTERTFQWVVKTEAVNIPAEVSKLSTMQAHAMKKDATIDPEKIKAKKAEMFDLTKPPMMKEDMHR